MSYRVDLLFGKESAETRNKRLRRIRWLLAVAAPLDLLGLVSCTALPGAALTLLAWQLSDQELYRAEEGLGGGGNTDALGRLRQVAGGLLAVCFVGFFVQMYLLSTGVYARWLAGILE